MPIRFSTRRRLHGWRDFSREILIIVVGVLIALGASHVAEQWSWDRRVAEAESQLARESQQIFLYAVEAVSAGPCIDTQLAALRERLVASGDTLDPAPVHQDAFADFVVRIPSRPMGTTVWEALGADGTVPHLLDWRRLRYAEIGHQVAVMSRFKDETDAFVGRLRIMGLPLQLDPATRSRLLETIEEQRYRSKLHALMSLQVMGAIRDLGHLPGDAAIAGMLGESGTLAYCARQGMPVADWREGLAQVPVLAPEA